MILIQMIPWMTLLWKVRTYPLCGVALLTLCDPLDGESETEKDRTKRKKAAKGKGKAKRKMRIESSDDEFQASEAEEDNAVEQEDEAENQVPVENYDYLAKKGLREWTRRPSSVSRQAGLIVDFPVNG